MTRGPQPFAKWAVLIAEDEHAELDPDVVQDEESFRAHLAAGDSPLASLWTGKLTHWDFDRDPKWAAGTQPRTDERRARTYDRLGFADDLRKALDAAAPVHKEPGTTVIARPGFTPWYTPQRAADRAFYWPKYRDLLAAKGLSAAAVGHLDDATHSVVERLADPEQDAPRQSKGLVVGYVQSGKTANFTGVTAKAIDAGYRLVIVLGGTLNNLRAQTQRRLDKELVGQENILGGADPADLDSVIGIDYVGDDDEWDDFVSYGARPSLLGHPDIDRLTTRDKDYAGLQQGIRALEFEKRDRRLPLHHPDNLHHTAARIMVVKKNKAVLEKLVTNLKQIQAQGLLSEIPALIIDDESDQASVNTTDPKKWEGGDPKRTAINALISQLLGLLPRAQYVGYTATPFANVFIDPGDGADLFPNDYLISLRRPDGYMGVQDFHDLDSAIDPEDRTFANSQELAHVRGVYEDSTGDDRLQEALDAFLLAGAVKLYRADHGVPERRFRHHTMLIHESVRMAEHAELALRVSTMWHKSAPMSHKNHDRLRALYESDFTTVSAARAADLPTPATYEELKPYISTARSLINKGASPVIVVNGDKESDYAKDDLDFDRTPNVWKILVGGTKLSRGFTVEGLTVTYYRRRTQQADTLMQMGRWFGFREGYRDLVRLYIGREEIHGRTTVDLYEAFEAVCRDEEAFRDQLTTYATLVDGVPQVTPAQIPPLVSQHLPWIKPSARNKMFNAELVEIRSPGKPIEPAAYPTDPRVTSRNTERWQTVLSALSGKSTLCRLQPDSATPLPRTFQAATTVVAHSELLGILSGLEWEGGKILAPHLAYLAQLDGRLGRVDDWLVIAPHRTERNRIEASIMGSGPFSLARRSRQAGKASFGRISGKEHRAYAQQLNDLAHSGTTEADTHTLSQHRGMILLYPVVEASTDAEVQAVATTGTVAPSEVIMAFTLIPPTAAIDSTRQLVRFRTKDSNDPNAAIVNAQ
ncbi:Z1 domain-containing protein [Streptomyces sp. NPDC050738]|uniref:Z1 domain-containing protein n=1 Tax=Streptomyces sp. NPDC050738 TaxID=3154744 RepID=UPI0034308A6C